MRVHLTVASAQITSNWDTFGLILEPEESEIHVMLTHASRLLLLLLRRRRRRRRGIGRDDVGCIFDPLVP